MSWLDKLKYRLALCDICDQKTERGTCKQCGCLITAKAAIPNARCPLGRWPR